MKKKAGKRYPSGGRKISDRERLDAQRETEWETKLPVLEKRCDMLGWRKTYENLQKVDKYGTAWGLYFLGGLLNRRRFEAADQFAVLRRDYVIAEGLPSETAPCASWEARTARSPTSEPSRADLVKVATYKALRGAIAPLHEAAAIDLVIGQGYSDAQILFDALDEIADVLKLPGFDRVLTGGG